MAKKARAGALMVGLGLGLSMTMADEASAQSCSFSMTDIDFGTVDLSSGNRIRISGQLTVNCTGSRRARMRICPNFGSGTGGNGAGADPRYLRFGSNRVNYNLFRNSGYTQIWGSHVWPWSPTPPTINLQLNNAGVGSVTVPVRAELYAGQAGVPNGTYTSSFSGGHTWVSYGYRRWGGCRRLSFFGGVRVPFNVRVTNTGGCTVNATAMDFGTRGVINNSVDSANTISVQCTAGVAYSIGLDGGLAGATNPTLRKLSNGSNQVTYGIYRNASRTAPWGNDSGSNTVDLTATGSVQTVTAYGRVPAQTTPVAGTYQDTIIVSLTY